MKLNQAIALLQGGAKSDGESALTRAYHGVQKSSLLSGLTKTYKPRDEDGETLPSEGTLLQARIPELLADAVPALVRMFDLTATVDVGNQEAKANVVVDGVTILSDVSVSTLLFLEKKFRDLATFVAKLPVLDPSEKWEDNGDGSFRTQDSVKTRSKKIPRNHVKAPATDKHPAQVEVFYEDVIVGDWTTVNFSGAISEKRKRELIAKVSKFQAALKMAREEANSTVVQDIHIGDAIFEYLTWVE